MKIYRVLNVVFVFILFTYCVAAQQDKQRYTDDFQKFWNEFRTAILSENKERVCSLTKFPFEVKGPADSDPIAYHDKKGFLRILDDILNQPIYRLKEPNLNTTSMREIIKNRTDAVNSDLLSDDFARIEQFTFIKEKSGWLFNRAYFEE